MARKKSNRKSTRKKPEASPAPRPDFWAGLPEHIQHLICLALLVAVSLGFYAPVHFSGKQLIGGDTVHWQAAAQAMLEYQEETGETALWAPNVFGGMPGYMISYAPEVYQLDNIANGLRKFLWPTSHLLFLLIGTYLLIFFLTRDKLSGVLAASAYALTTYLPVLLIAGHNSKFITLCYSPWLVLAFAYALRNPKLLSGLFFAAALALNLRAGHVQITYYVAFLLGIWWIIEAVDAARNGKAKELGMATGWLALGSVLGLLMVAQPYLSNVEYKRFTVRGASTGGVEGGMDWTYAMGWSHEFSELFTLLIANLYGGGGSTYWGTKIFTAGPHYVGGIVILLAILALWRLRKNMVLGFGIATFLMLLFAMGEFLPVVNRFMFNYFPLFDAFRVPETWLSIVAFALAVLAGVGMYYTVRKEADGTAEADKTKAILITVGAVIGLVVVLFVMKDVFFSFEKAGEYEMAVQQIASSNNVDPSDPRVAQAAGQLVAELKTQRVDLFEADALRTLLFLVLATLALWAYRKDKIPAWAMQAALVLLVCIDLGGVGRRYVNEDRLVQSREIADQIPEYDFDRFILEQQEVAGGPGHFRVLSLEGSPTQTSRPSYFHESLSGYHGAKLRLYQDYLENLLTDPVTRGLSMNALALMNTRYIVARGRLPGMSVVFQDPTGFSVMEFADTLPRAFFVGDTEVIASPEETWARLQDPEFDLRQTALLPEALDFTTTPLDSASTATATLERFSPREIKWTLQTDASRLLVVSEVYYPAGWKAYIDEEEVPIHRADYLLRAVPVPAGEHTLTMSFAPRSHYLGLWLSGLSTIFVYGTIVLLLALAHRQRSQRTTP